MLHTQSTEPVLLDDAEVRRLRIGALGPVDFVESVYLLDGGLSDWLSRVVATAQPFSPEAGVVGFLQRAHGDGVETVGLVATGDGASLSYVRTLQERYFRPELVDHFNSPLARSGSLIGQLTAAGLDARAAQEVSLAAGYADALGLYANLGDGWFVTLLAPAQRVIGEPRALRLRWSRLSHHLGAGLRLRRRLLASAADPEMVLTADGSLVHVSPEWATTTAPQRVTEASRAVAMARGRMRYDAPDDALSIWQGLVDGRWSLADRVEPSGRRVIVAYLNEPDLARPALITAREAVVARHAADGAALKEIAYALGISIATVQGALGRAMKKLRVTSRAELARVVHATQGYGPGDIMRVSLDATEAALAGLAPGLREVARLAAAGHAVADIARLRGSSARTVAHQLSVVYQKLGVRSKAELAARVGGAPARDA